ncbi:putative K domain, type 1, vacuolar (H+)-ATPase G subunit [Rosa chinensis]|uniref:Putative K domain, type 1, vacuolar (H+)-ATPase G subunit n=1 Tax=Rosa chinensis TaxID=74649 RepID=A0A2P6PEU0_ROSCH|nr:putative K domain, type 1, vacuolar (H+)-ATPase G subunit [Rosa chinensis]
MDSVRGQGGIQMLLTAEEEAQHIVNSARNCKCTSGSSGSNVKRLEEETETKIKSLKESASKVQSDIVGMVMKYITDVKI